MKEHRSPLCSGIGDRLTEFDVHFRNRQLPEICLPNLGLSEPGRGLILPVDRQRQIGLARRLS